MTRNPPLPAEMDRSDLTGLLTQLKRQLRGESFTIEEMIAAVSDRGFGPLLLIPSLLTILPTGAIPGIPSLMAVVNTLIAGQLILGRRHPWLPRRLRQIRINRNVFEAAYNRAVPVTRRIDRMVYPRLTPLTRGPAPRLIAALCLALGLLFIPLDLVPFAAAIPASAIAMLALGLSVRDGLLILLGLVMAISGVTGLYFWQT